MTRRVEDFCLQRCDDCFNFPRLCFYFNLIVCQGLCTKSYKNFHRLDDLTEVFLYYLQIIKIYLQEDFLF